MSCFFLFFFFFSFHFINFSFFFFTFVLFSFLRVRIPLPFVVFFFARLVCKELHEQRKCKLRLVGLLCYHQTQHGSSLACSSRGCQQDDCYSRPRYFSNCAIWLPTLFFICLCCLVAGKNVSDMLNSILAENAWGRVLTEGEEKKWVLAEECLTPTLSPPAKGLVNYHDYIEVSSLRKSL